MKLLLDAGVDTDVKTDIVKLLLDAGADKDVLDAGADKDGEGDAAALWRQQEVTLTL